MKVTIICVVPIKYHSKKRDADVEGTELHIERDVSTTEKTKGYRGNKVVDKIFTHLDCSSIQPDRKYDMLYDMTGGKYPELVEIKPL